MSPQSTLVSQKSPWDSSIANSSASTVRSVTCLRKSISSQLCLRSSLLQMQVLLRKTLPLLSCTNTSQRCQKMRWLSMRYKIKATIHHNRCQLKEATFSLHRSCICSHGHPMLILLLMASRRKYCSSCTIKMCAASNLMRWSHVSVSSSTLRARLMPNHRNSTKKATLRWLRRSITISLRTRC